MADRGLFVMLTFATLFKFFTALFAVANPISTAPLFLAFMHGESKEVIKKATVTVAFTVFLTLTFFSLFGLQILNLFGISIGGFQVSAGIILLLMSISMLNAQTSRIKHTKGEGVEAEEKDNPAIFPLAIPLSSGPGAITTVIVMTDQTTGVVNHLLIIGVIVALSLTVLISLTFARVMSKKLGKTGLNIITRIMGMILAAVAVEIMVVGLLKLFPGLQQFVA